MSDSQPSHQRRTLLPKYMRVAPKHSVVPSDFVAPSPSPSPAPSTSTSPTKKGNINQQNCTTPVSRQGRSSINSLVSPTDFNSQRHRASDVTSSASPPPPPIRSPFISNSGYDFWDVEKRERQKNRKVSSSTTTSSPTNNNIKELRSGGTTLGTSFISSTASDEQKGSTARNQPSPSRNSRNSSNIVIGLGTVGLGSEAVKREESRQRQEEYERWRDANDEFEAGQKARVGKVKSTSEEVKTLFLKQRAQLTRDLQNEKKERKALLKQHKADDQEILEIKRAMTSHAHRSEIEARQSIKAYREEYTREAHADAQRERIIAVSRGDARQIRSPQTATVTKSGGDSPLLTKKFSGIDFFAASIARSNGGSPMLTNAVVRTPTPAIDQTTCVASASRSVASPSVLRRVELVKQKHQLSQEMKAQSERRERSVDMRKKQEESQKKAEAHCLKEERAIVHEKVLQDYHAAQTTKQKAVLKELSVWRQLGNERKERHKTTSGAIPVLGESAKPHLAAIRATPGRKARRTTESDLPTDSA